MKKLVNVLNESIVNEAAPKSLVKTRTGNTLYILPVGERKATVVKITNITKRKMGPGWEGSYYRDVTLSDNPYKSSIPTLPANDSDISSIVSKI